MEKNLYIDASHPNETRVVLKSGDNIEDYEYEGLKNNLIKNNVYLGKVSRIEPSLQAAFIDFGRDRHGFLSFNDIQSDYYQIPKADLEKIKEEEEKAREELSKEVEAKEEENIAEGKLEAATTPPPTLNLTEAEDGVAPHRTWQHPEVAREHVVALLVAGHEVGHEAHAAALEGSVVADARRAREDRLRGEDAAAAPRHRAAQARGVGVIRVPGGGRLRARATRGLGGDAPHHLDDGRDEESPRLLDDGLEEAVDHGAVAAVRRVAEDGHGLVDGRPQHRAHRRREDLGGDLRDRGR